MFLGFEGLGDKRSPDMSSTSNCYINKKSNLPPFFCCIAVNLVYPCCLTTCLYLHGIHAQPL